MQLIAFTYNSCNGLYFISLGNSIYMISTNVDANTTASRTKRHRTGTGQSLGQSKQSAARGIAKRLACILAYMHRCLTCISICCGKQYDIQRMHYIMASIDDILYMF